MTTALGLRTHVEPMHSSGGELAGPTAARAAAAERELEEEEEEEVEGPVADPLGPSTPASDPQAVTTVEATPADVTPAEAAAAEAPGPGGGGAGAGLFGASTFSRRRFGTLAQGPQWDPVLSQPQVDTLYCVLSALHAVASLGSIR